MDEHECLIRKTTIYRNQKFDISVTLEIPQPDRERDEKGADSIRRIMNRELLRQMNEWNVRSYEKSKNVIKGQFKPTAGC